MIIPTCNNVIFTGKLIIQKYKLAHTRPSRPPVKAKKTLLSLNRRFVAIVGGLADTSGSGNSVTNSGNSQYILFAKFGMVV